MTKRTEFYKKKAILFPAVLCTKKVNAALYKFHVTISSRSDDAL